MDLETNAESNEPFQIHIVIGNINGKLSKGRGTRRTLIIENVLKGSKIQPDFLAFQDGVQPIDVREFIQALNTTWSSVNPEPSYCDIHETANRPPVVATGKKLKPYNKNKEALLYDANRWDRLREKEDSLYTTFNDKRLLRERCRFGIFKKRSSESQAIVVSYHASRRRTKDSEKEKRDLARRECDLLSTITFVKVF
jgi:hypothetical protein